MWLLQKQMLGKLNACSCHAKRMQDKTKSQTQVKKKLFKSVTVLETTLKKQNCIHDEIKNRMN